MRTLGSSLQKETEYNITLYNTIRYNTIISVTGLFEDYRSMQQESKDYDLCSEKLIYFAPEKQQHGDRAKSTLICESDCLTNRTKTVKFHRHRT